MAQPKYKSEYQRLRKNIIRRTKSLLSKGYYIPEEDLLRITPKKYSELSKPPTKQNIQRLKNIQNIDIPKKFKYLEVDYDTGEVKEQSYKYGISQRITESKYGVISDEKYAKLLEQANAEKPKRKTPKRYTPFTDAYNDGDYVPDVSSPSYDEDYDGVEWEDKTKNIVEKVEAELEELMMFSSRSRKKNRAESQTELVRENARRIYQALIEQKDKDYSGLSKRLSDNSMRVNKCLDTIGHMYVGDENTEELIGELLEYINGSITEEEAKELDDGFDSYDEQMELDRQNYYEEQYKNTYGEDLYQ